MPPDLSRKSNTDSPQLKILAGILLTPVKNIKLKFSRVNQLFALWYVSYDPCNTSRHVTYCHLHYLSMGTVHWVCRLPMLIVCWCTQKHCMQWWLWHGRNIVSVIFSVTSLPFTCTCIHKHTHTSGCTLGITSTQTTRWKQIVLITMEDGKGLLVRVDIPDVKAQVRL